MGGKVACPTCGVQSSAEGHKTIPHLATVKCEKCGVSNVAFKPEPASEPEPEPEKKEKGEEEEEDEDEPEKDKTKKRGKGK